MDRAKRAVHRECGLGQQRTDGLVQVDALDGAVHVGKHVLDKAVLVAEIKQALQAQHDAVSPNVRRLIWSAADSFRSCMAAVYPAIVIDL